MRSVMPRLLRALAAPAMAASIALTATALLIAAVGLSPVDTLRTMVVFGSEPQSLVSAVNRATAYFLAGFAVSISFRMNLFNIGVEGQYRIGALVATVVGTTLALPEPLMLPVTVLSAMVAGALWAGIAGWLRVTRGINEVISTLLLNYVATALVAYTLTNWLLSDDVSGGSRQIHSAAWIPSLDGLLGLDVPGAQLGGAVVGAVMVGVIGAVVLNRTWYGADLRTYGLSASAARASGMDVRRIIVVTMLVSGAIGGLVGLPELLGNSHRFGYDFPPNLGFTGIAVALLGRNKPLGIAAAALLFGWMERGALGLDLEGIPKEIVTIAQAVIVFSVLVSFEAARRWEAAAARRGTRRMMHLQEVGA